MKAFGTEFILISDVIQPLPEIFTGGPWIHLATVKRGFREYVAFKKANSREVWVEIADPTEPGLFKKIEDDQEWIDIVSYLKATQLLEVGKRRELSFGDRGLI